MKRTASGVVRASRRDDDEPDQSQTVSVFVLTKSSCPKRPKVSANAAKRTAAAAAAASPKKTAVSSQYPPAYPIIPKHKINKSWEKVPPAPLLEVVEVARDTNSVTLQWTARRTLLATARVTAYEVFACQETDAPPDTSMWIRLTDANGMPAERLPMRCMLIDFAVDHTYHFGVRPVDEHGRRGPMAVVKTDL